MRTNALESSRSFWEEKANENAYWYVSSFGPYGQQDLEGFWASGQRIWNDLKNALGYSPSHEHLVVEVGCGVGRLTRAIAPEVGRVVAFDISQQMLAIARQAGMPNVEFHRTDGASLLPVADSSADMVLAYCVFQHLPSEEILGAYLEEMRRVAKPGALLAFTTEPRTAMARASVLLRLRRCVKEAFLSKGARGLYRSEWYGIRPSEQKVRQLSPVPLMLMTLRDGKWLFCGQA